MAHKISQQRDPWLEDVVAEKALGESLSDHPALKGKVTLAEIRTGCKLVFLGLCEDVLLIVYTVFGKFLPIF